jgi:hypothetical protein
MSGVAKYSRELIFLDALKIASDLQGYPQYLAMFSQIRQAVIENIQSLSK